jgi:hypothetical protein
MTTNHPPAMSLATQQYCAMKKKKHYQNLNGGNLRTKNFGVTASDFLFNG